MAWTCFHCDETFTDRDSAAMHFGTHEHQQPACLIDIAAYREMEALQIRYLNEDAGCHRAMYRMQSEHTIALRREEEKGYARGLRDAELDATAAPVVVGEDGFLREALKRLSRAVDDNSGSTVNLTKADACAIGQSLTAALAEDKDGA